MFHSDIDTDIEKTPEGRYLTAGGVSVCLVFDSLAEAENYCEAKVNSIANLRCDIYDHTRPGGKWDWILVTASVPFFWMEGHAGNARVISLVVGVNLVFAGLRLVYWGKGGIERRRTLREQ